MESSVHIHKDALELGICFPTVCMIQNVSVVQQVTALDDDISQLMQTLTSCPETILGRSEVRGFRELFAMMGYSKQLPAGERLIESFRRRGFKHFNNLIDAYNIASALFGAGIGMHNGSTLKTDMEVYRADGNEMIVPLFKSSKVTIKKGDLVYGQSLHPYAWLGERDVDSDEFKITDETTSLLLVVLGNAATSAAYNRDTCDKVFDLIKKTCPNAVAEFLTIRRDAE